LDQETWKARDTIAVLKKRRDRETERQRDRETEMRRGEEEDRCGVDIAVEEKSVWAPRSSRELSSRWYVIRYQMLEGLES
jgi:hypothetical protein